MQTAAWLSALWKNLIERRQRERELHEEIRATFDLIVEEQLQAGLTLEAARRAAAIEIGGVEQLKEQVRYAKAGFLLDSAYRDFHYALRSLRKHSGFAAAAVFTLTLGIGATTTIFSVVYSVLLKPLPFDEPERLVSLGHHALAANRSMNNNTGTYFTYLDGQQVFSEMGAWDTFEVSITGRGAPEQVEALAVANGTLAALRVNPVVGRIFGDEDLAPGRPLRAVLSYGYWQRRFGGAGDVPGQRLEISGRPFEIIGVLPASFKFLRAHPAVIVPLELDRSTMPQVRFGFQVLGRLKPGVTLSEANRDVGRMISFLPRSFDVLQLRPDVHPLADDMLENVRQVLWFLLAAVGIVLLISCANVANLFLVRAEARQQELAMRAALGASHGRIARALLSESLLLALAAGAFGLVLAQAAISLLRRMAPAGLPRVDEIALDPIVLLFTVTISGLAALLFGLVVVIKFGTPNITAIRDGGRSSSGGPGRHRTRNALVVSEVALALVLLVVSGLMIRTFVAMRLVHPGFERPAQVQSFSLNIPEQVMGDLGQVARTHEQILQRLAQIPGVDAVGLSSSITMDGEDNSSPLFIDGMRLTPNEFPPFRRFKSIAPGYFEAMGNRIVAGRSITWTEIHERRPVVVVSETLAREYWSEPSRALGQRVRNQLAGPWQEIVGVVGDERDDGLNRPATAIVYWPMLNDTYQRRTFVYAVRSNRVGAPGFVQEMHQAVWSVNPNLPLANVRTLEDIRTVSMAQTSFVMVMLSIAATVALLLGVVGLYSVIAYIVAQRTREVGIRIALGAQVGHVQRMFLRQGFRLTATGIVCGIGVAVGLTRVMSALLFGVGPLDPTTYVAVSATLASVALLATYIPARRASRVDPVAALRADV